MTESIQKAVELLGGNVALAAVIGGCHPSFVSQLVTGRRKTPVEACRQIEAATKGVVTRYDLRPDVFGEAPAKTKKLKAG